MRKNLSNALSLLFWAGFTFGIPIMVVGGFFFSGSFGIKTSLEAMQFQQTHPIVRATVLSTYTHTYTSTTYDSSTNTSTSQTETETCADTIQFLANGQNLKVNVRPLLACGVETGDRPRIAYDPQHPTHLQFVPSGGPFWGNMLGVIIAFATIGVALPFDLLLVIPLIEGWKFWPRGTKAFFHVHEAISWWMFGISFLVLLLCFILQIVFGAVSS